MNDLERLKRAEEAEPMAVVVLNKVPERCQDCPVFLRIPGDPECNQRIPYLDDRGSYPYRCPLREAIGIIEPNGHVVYLREDNP